MGLPTFPTGLMGAATHIFAITPSDAAAQPDMKAIRANTAGNVTLRAKDSTADVTIAMAVGEVIDVIPLRIMATGTTATLHGLA